MRAMEYSSTHYEKARHYQGSKILQMKIWNFWNRKNQFWIKFNDVSSLCKLLGGAGKKQGHHLNLFYSGIFLKKGNLLWFSWFLHYLNSPSQTWSLGRSKMTFNLSCVFLKLLKYSKIEKKMLFLIASLGSRRPRNRFVGMIRKRFSQIDENW